MTQHYLTDEYEVLLDIERATGRLYPAIQSVEITNASVALEIAKVIDSWITREPPPGIRLALYSLFRSKYMYKFLDKLLRWWEQETDVLNSETINQYIARLMRPSSDGPRVWRSYLNRRVKRWGDEQILVKLHKCPEIRGEVEAHILARLIAETAESETWTLYKHCTFDDVTLKELISKKSASSKSRRVSMDRHKWRTYRYVNGAAAGPELELEILSFEVDNDQLIGALEILVRDNNIQLDIESLSISLLPSLKSLNDKQWLVLTVAGAEAKQLRLWFRREDVDVTEVWLTQSDGGDREFGKEAHS